MTPIELSIVDQILSGNDADKALIARSGPDWARWYLLRRGDSCARQLVAEYGNDLMCCALLKDPCPHVREAAQDRLDELSAASAQSGAAN